MSDALNALLTKPHERSERANEIIARQPMIATHPLVSGAMPVFMPHRPERPEKSEGGIRFNLVSDFTPKGDQPQAIKELVAGISKHEQNQVLLGVTGSGKTFTMAHVIAETQRPALILAPNKTLAAQLYGEFKSFFPENAVEYFVSYYDYYQPEAYVPRTDTYIEKEASVNEQIDRMRHAATRSLLERDDVIIVASVSCIYGIGSVETYTAMTFTVKVGERLVARPVPRRSRGAALPPQRRQLHPRLVPRSRRHGRSLPGPLGGSRLALLAVRRRDREYRRVRSADRPEGRRPRAGEALRQLALRDAEADAAAGHQVDQERAEDAARRVVPRRQAARSPAPGTAHHLRHGNDGGDGLLRRHRELFALSDRPQSRRAAADAVRISARQRPRLRRRKPRHRAADRRHVPRRLPAQGDARRIRLPPALLHGQSSAAFRGMGRHAAAIGVRLGDAADLGTGTDRRRLCRAGHPPDGADRSRRSKSVRPNRRSTICSTKCGRFRRRASAPSSPFSPSAWPRT